MNNVNGEVLHFPQISRTRVSPLDRVECHAQDTSYHSVRNIIHVFSVPLTERECNQRKTGEKIHANYPILLTSVPRYVQIIIYIYIYIYIRGSLNKIPDFFGMGNFIYRTHMKL